MDHSAATNAAAFGMSFAVLGIIIGLIVIFFLPLWRIISKTGLPGALSLLLYIPVINIVMVLILAFTKWPIEKEFEALKNVQKIPAQQVTPGEVTRNGVASS